MFPDARRIDLSTRFVTLFPSIVHFPVSLPCQRLSFWEPFGGDGNWRFYCFPDCLWHSTSQTYKPVWSGILCGFLFFVLVSDSLKFLNWHFYSFVYFNLWFRDNALVQRPMPGEYHNSILKTSLSTKIFKMVLPNLVSVQYCWNIQPLSKHPTQPDK